MPAVRQRCLLAVNVEEALFTRAECYRTQREAVHIEQRVEFGTGALYDHATRLIDFTQGSQKAVWLQYRRFGWFDVQGGHKGEVHGRVAVVKHTAFACWYCPMLHCVMGTLRDLHTRAVVELEAELEGTLSDLQEVRSMTPGHWYKNTATPPDFHASLLFGKELAKNGNMLGDQVMVPEGRGKIKRKQSSAPKAYWDNWEDIDPKSFDQFGRHKEAILAVGT